MKKIGYYLSCLVCTFFVLPIIAYATGTVNFSLTSSASVYVNSEITVSLNLTSINGSGNGNNLTVLTGTLTYDEEKLEYVGAIGEVSGLSISKVSDGNILVTIANPSSSIDTAIRLATITFEGKSEITSTQLKYTVSNAESGTDNELVANNPTLNIQVLREKSTNNNLKSLTVKDNANKVLTLTPIFNSNVLSYTLTVPYSTSYLSITPITDSVYATSKISGSLVLVEGVQQLITVTVTSESGANKAYIIQAYRENKISDVATLKAIKITGYSKLNFDSDKTTYTLIYNDESDLKDFDLECEATSEKASVDIDKPEKLKDGSQIIITVVAEDAITTKQYILKIKVDENSVISIKKDVTSNKTFDIKDILGKIIIGAIILLITLIGILLIYLRKNSSNKKKKPKDEYKEDIEKTKIYSSEKEENNQEKQESEEQEDSYEDTDEIDYDNVQDEKGNDEEDNPTRIFD